MSYKCPFCGIAACDGTPWRCPENPYMKAPVQSKHHIWIVPQSITVAVGDKIDTALDSIEHIGVGATREAALKAAIEGRSDYDVPGCRWRGLPLAVSDGEGIIVEIIR